MHMRHTLDILIPLDILPFKLADSDNFVFAALSVDTLE